MRKIVVVAPTYNEEENIASFLNSVLKIQNLDVVISDSHSSDTTSQIVKKIARAQKRVHYLDVNERGLGLGLFRGIDFAIKELGAKTIITMEADLSHDPRQIPQFLTKLKDADLVVGSRYIVGGKIENWSWWRKILSRSANFVLMVLLMTGSVHEFTNLYRAFTSDAWKKIKAGLEIRSGWLFVPEFVFEAIDKNIKIVEQPITYLDRFGGRSKMNTVSYTRSLLTSAIQYRLKKSASFFKFLVVGGIGFAINTTALIIGVKFGLTPANAGAAGAELAILSNFSLNNFWTFSDRKLNSWKKIPGKFIQFNVLSLGSVVIQYISLRIGESIFGLERYKTAIVNLPIVSFITWYMLFYVMGVGVGLIWNYTIYSRVIWAKKKK